MIKLCKAGSLIVLLAVALSACKTTFQYAGTNNTNQALVYTAKVDDKDQANATVTKSSALPMTKVGDYSRGSKAEVDVSLPRGGRVSRKFQIISDDPDPLSISVVTDTVQGVELDLGNAADIEKSITDVSNSYVAPTSLVDNLIQTSLGGVYLATDNPNDAANPKLELLYGPSELGSKAPNDFYGSGQFPLRYQTALILDKDSAAKISAEVPSIATVKADYQASEIYKYELTLDNTGWRRSPITWNKVRISLMQSEDGKRILKDISNKITNLQSGQHIYFLDQTYIIGLLNVSTYQGQRLDASVDVQANNYLALNAAYSMSTNQFDTKTAQNIVLRVKFEELSLINLDAGQIVDFRALNSALVDNSRLLIANVEKPLSVGRLQIVASPVMRGKRF